MHTNYENDHIKRPQLRGNLPQYAFEASSKALFSSVFTFSNCILII